MKLRHLLKVFTAILLCSAMLFSLCACMGETESEIEKHEGKEEKKEKAVTVIATDNFSVTKSQMSYYFYSQYWNTYNSLASYGLDPSVYGLTAGQSLKTQKCTFDSSKTWFEYFMESAMISVEEQLALCEAAKAAGIELTEKDHKEIESVIDSIEETAKAQGYSLKNYIKANYGSVVSVSDVEKSLETEILATRYLESELKKVDVSDAAIKAVYDSDPDEYDTVDYLTFTFDPEDIYDGTDPVEIAAAERIAKEYAEKLSESTNISVFEKIIEDFYTNVLGKTEAEAKEKLAEGEHIVSGAHFKEYDEQLSWAFSDDTKRGSVKAFTEDEAYTVILVTRPRGLVEGTYSVDVRHIVFDLEDEADAKKVYEEWKNNGSAEADFEKLAFEHSKDIGSKFDGGLYEGVAKDQMVKEFNDWIFDEARKNGDHGIVKTTYGWHIMYYVDGSEEWQATIKNELQTEKSESAIEDAAAKYKVTVDYDAINDINA